MEGSYLYSFTMFLLIGALLLRIALPLSLGLEHKRGEFIILKDDKEVGREVFNLDKANGHFILNARLSVKEPNPIELEGSLEVDSNLSPVLYHLEATTSSGTLRISLKSKHPGFHMEFSQPGFKDEKDIYFKERAVVLDNFLLSHYLFLLGILEGNRSDTSFEALKAIVPQSFGFFNLTVSESDSIGAKSGDVSFSVKRYKVRLGRYRVEIFERKGELVGGYFPEDELFYYRKDLYPKGLRIIPFER